MSKVYDAIMGLVVGDALGVPFEFRPRDSFKATDMVGHGTYDMPIGTWSDDSSLTLATMASIADKGVIDCQDIMENFKKWLYHGEFTPDEVVFDVGRTTCNAIKEYARTGDIATCGSSSFDDNGNGSLMRILPLAFMKCDATTIYEVSALTHAHDISKTGCLKYVRIAENLLNGWSLQNTLLHCKSYDEYKNINKLKNMTRDEICSSGYVVDTLEAALWCLLHSNSYRKCVLMAINLGGDTDTVAAVAGGLAGIIYGVGGKKGIPKKWIKQIKKHKDIKDLCKEFEKMINF